MPAAGISLNGNVKKISKKGKYLYSVKKLSVDFRGIMLKTLKKQLKSNGLLNQYQSIINEAWSKKWVVFSEPSFGDAQHVIKYLGQYTHRIAISNQRIQKIDNNRVSFYYKDYKDQSKRKIVSLTGVEFLRRFCMHILPKGFVKIRYYGILSNRYSKQTAMYRKPQIQIPNETPEQRMFRLTGMDIYQCPFCKKGKMHIVEIIPRIRSPAAFLRPRSKNIKC